MSTKLMHSWLECSSDGSKAQSSKDANARAPFNFGETWSTFSDKYIITIMTYA